jgi:O-antigen/teichoic acid export membrane protein
LTERRLADLHTGGVWALASVAVALGAGLVRTIVIARFLDPFAIGVMGIALLVLGFVEAVSSAGVDTALVAERRDIETYLDPAFTIQLTRGVVVFGLLWITAPAVAWGFGNDAAGSVIRSVAAIAALRGLANPAVALAVKRLDFRRVFWWSLPEVLASVGVTVALAYLRRDVWALVIGAVAGQVVGTIASYALVPRMPRVVVVPRHLYDLLRFARFVSGSRALMYFSVNLDVAFVGVTMGTHTLGLYQFATRVAELPIVTFTRAVAQVALPALTSLTPAAGTLRRTWRAMLGWVLAVNAATAIFLVLFGKAAVHAVAGERWLEAVPIIQLLSVAMVFRAVVILTGQLLDAVGKPAVTLRLNAVRLAALAALLPLLGTWGLQGVAQAVLVASAGAALLGAWLCEPVLSS